MTMKMGSNQREIGSCSCKQSSYFVSRKQCIKTESPIATRSIATREQWAYLVQSQNFTFQTYFSCSSAHYTVFPFLPRGFGDFAHYCVVLLNTPLSDQDNKKNCLQRITSDVSKHIN